MDDPVKQAEKQAQRYWYSDGLSEMAAGGVILLLALYYTLLSWLDPQGTQPWLMPVGQLVVFILACLGATLLVRLLKERITYPRTGYVALRRNSGPKRTLIILVAVMGGVVFGMAATVAARSEFIRHWVLPAFPGLFIAYMGSTYGLRRFYPMAVYTWLVGATSTYLGLGSLYDSAVFFAAFGLGWLVTGAWGLRSYLAATHPGGEELE